VSIRISTKGFKEAVAKLRVMEDIGATRQFQKVLVDALEPMKVAAIANVHSVTGRTAQAIVVAAGASNINPSAYIKVDKTIATALWRGKPYAYPYAVEFGHGGPHPAVAYPFFGPAIQGNKAAARRIVRDGIQDVLNPYITRMSIGGEFS
jgi:hypothetical protein